VSAVDGHSIADGSDCLAIMQTTTCVLVLVRVLINRGGHRQVWLALISHCRDWFVPALPSALVEFDSGTCMGVAS
jgi:hypothetical protein